MLRQALLVAVVGCMLACDDKTGSAPPDYAPLLRASSDVVILPSLAAFAARADELAAATQALDATTDAASLAKAQAAWRAARAAYRVLDAQHFGPVTERGIAGRVDLAPASTADIDAIVAQTTPIDAPTVAAASGKTKGFLGLEYLLFSDAGIDAALARLRGDDAVTTRRRTLARAMAAEIAATAHELDDAWSPTKGGFAKELTGAGAASQHYASQRAAVDDLVGGVGYALEVVVAIDLATPLGLKSGGAVDPGRIITKLSENSVADMLSTLDGVRASYETGGVSEHVKTRSAALDERARSELADCTSKIKALSEPLAKMLAEDPTTVRGAFEACKQLKATWNVEVTSALGATLKPTDNDGD